MTDLLGVLRSLYQVLPIHHPGVPPAIVLVVTDRRAHRVEPSLLKKPPLSLALEGATGIIRAKAPHRLCSDHSYLNRLL